MAWTKWAPLLALCVGAVGCTRLEEAAMPVAAKINAAYPVAPEVKLAQERLDALLADDAKALNELHNLAEAQMTLRALACSKGRVLGRLDAVAAAKGLSLDRTCFQDQDQDLLNLFGIRTVGVLMGKPALRPKQALGQAALLPKGKLSWVSAAAVAAEANVGVVVDGQGQGVIAELPSGKALAELPRQGSLNDTGLLISPNGRVVVLSPSGRGPVFIEAESGHTLWSAPGTGNQRMLAWLPEVTGWVMTGADGEVMLADGLKGTLQRHPQSLKHSAHAVGIPGPSSRLLMGSSRELALLTHARAPEGISSAVLKSYTLGSRGISGSPPLPMRGGRLVVFASYPDLGWLDLDSGDSGVWRTSPMFRMPVAKLDETHLLMDAQAASDRPAASWVFDVEQGGITALDDGVRQGTLQPLGGRAGFLRRGSDTWLGDAVKVAADASSQSLSEALAAYDLQLQLARVEAAARQNAFDDSHPAASATAPGLGSVPLDAEVHMVGVYEGPRGSRGDRSDAKSPVRVTVGRSSRPVVLVLASYEAVNWVIQPAGARISAVLLSGYKASTVQGAPDVPQLRIGTSYAYAPDSAEYVRLRQAVTQYTGPREIKSFQGAYNGAEFTVGSGR